MEFLVARMRLGTWDFCAKILDERTNHHKIKVSKLSFVQSAISRDFLILNQIFKKIILKDSRGYFTRFI